MKYLLTTILTMAAIIAAQMGLTYVFDFHTGELFGKAAMTALFWYHILRSFRGKREAA